MDPQSIAKGGGKVWNGEVWSDGQLCEYQTITLDWNQPTMRADEILSSFLPFRYPPNLRLYLLNRLLSTYYTRRRTHEQQHLLKLLKRQHELLEEVKRKSGWYKTKDLLDRYEEGGSVSVRFILLTSVVFRLRRRG